MLRCKQFILVLVLDVHSRLELKIKKTRLTKTYLFENLKHNIFFRSLEINQGNEPLRFSLRFLLCKAILCHSYVFKIVFLVLGTQSVRFRRGLRKCF